MKAINSAQYVNESLIVHLFHIFHEVGFVRVGCFLFSSSIPSQNDWRNFPSCLLLFLTCFSSFGEGDGRLWISSASVRPESGGRGVAGVARVTGVAAGWALGWAAGAGGQDEGGMGLAGVGGGGVDKVVASEEE